MSSNDVRDMLDLPDAASRPAKKLKVAAPRPILKGLAREILNLGGDNPISIVPPIPVFKAKKKKAPSRPAARWELKPFKNSARSNDNLVLRHWRKAAAKAPVAVPNGDGSPMQTESPQDIEDSAFAKYNVQVNLPEYNDEQYNERLKSDDWTKDETDYLMNLVREYDIRWPVIYDRYDYRPPLIESEAGAADGVMIPISPKNRETEHLKARYYFVVGTMMAVLHPPEYMKQDEFALHELMLRFNPAQETVRKGFADAAMNRTKEEAREEESLLLELKRILARSERLGEERRELYARLEAPPSTANIGVYTSSQGLQQLLQQLMTADKSKKRRSLMGTEGISPASGPNGTNQSSNLDRRDSTARESISGPSMSANNNKKGLSQPGTSERRQLSDEEERVYGVSHHERLTASGPAFRHEKISKPIQSKSSIQQQKINNVLTELEIPLRLVMPTSDVGDQFEGLLGNVHALLEMRKVTEKLQGEIGILQAQKAEREKRERAERGEPESTPADGTANGDDGVDGTDEQDVKEEDVDREKSVAPSIVGASAHKRSASVLSTVSDKSAKRQRR